MAIAINSNHDLTDYECSSTTSNLIGTGAQTYTIQTGKGWTAGDTLHVSATAATLRTRMRASVTSYNSGTGSLVVNVTSFEVDQPSSTSLTVGTGAKTLVTSPGLALGTSSVVRVVRYSASATFMAGTVTSYNSTTGDLVINATSSGGSGTFTDWSVVSDGTFSAWNIEYGEQDQFNINTTSIFTITTSNRSPLGQISSIDRGRVNISNSSTSTPIVVTWSPLQSNGGLIITGNSVSNITGNWISLGTGNGLTAQVISAPASIDYPTQIETETSAGSGVYICRPIAVVNATASNMGYGTINQTNAAGDFYNADERGNVFLFDEANHTITSINPVPSGANIRIPNIHITTLPLFTYLSADITNVAVSATMNYGYGTLSANNITMIVDTEKLASSARTAADVNTITRANNSTVAAAHTKGTRVFYLLILGTTSNINFNNGVRYKGVFTNPSGITNANICSFSQFSCQFPNAGGVSLQHCGFFHMELNNTFGDMYLRYCVANGDQRSLITNQCFWGRSCQGAIDMAYIYGFSNIATNVAGNNSSGNIIYFFNCTNVTNFSNIFCISTKKAVTGWQYGTVQLYDSVFTNIIGPLTIIGGQLSFNTQTNVTVTGFRHSDTATNVADTVNSNSCLYMLLSSNITIFGITCIGTAPRGNIISGDGVLSNTLKCYNITYDQQGNTNFAFGDTLVGFQATNCYFPNPRSTSTEMVNTGGNVGTLRKIWSTTPQAYTAGKGIGLWNNAIYDSVTAKSVLWNTTTAFMTVIDFGPYSVLVDDGVGATGTLELGPFGLMATRAATQALTGTAYCDNGGRVYLPTIGDTATYTSWEPIRSITSFQNTAPIYQTNVGTVTTLGNFSYQFQIANPGGAYSALATLNGANLSAAIAALSGYDSNVGFNMKIVISATASSATNYVINLRMATNNDTNYNGFDSTITFTGVASNETVYIKKASDNSTLYTFTGGGTKNLYAYPNVGTSIYLEKWISGVLYVTTVASPATLLLGTNPTYDLTTATIFVSGLVSGSRIQVYNVTDSVEIYNGVVAGTTYSQDYPSTATKTIRLRAANQSGTTAYLLYSATGIFDNGVSFLVSQVLDSVYNTNAIDGSTITGISWNVGAVDIDFTSVSSSIVGWKTLYASYCYELTTSSGIQTFVSLMTAQDTLNYVFDPSIVFNETGGGNVIVGQDGYGSRSDSGSLLGTGQIQIDNGKAYLAGGDLAAIKANTALIPALL